MDIVVVGSIAYDSILAPEGKTENQLGGSATYFSVAASYFTKVGLVGVVGSDFQYPDKETLINKGIDLSGLETKAGSTFRWSGEYMADLNNAVTLDTQLNVFSEFKPKLKDAHIKSKYLFLANIDPRLQHNVLDKMCQNNPFVACDTMNFWIEESRGELLNLIKRVDTLLINETEARQITNESHLPKAAEILLDSGLKTVVIKRGEYGVALFNNSFRFAAPAYPVRKVVDPTGAGDSFAGGYMGYLATSGDTSNEGLRKAAILGSTMASFAVESFGIVRLCNLNEREIFDRFQAYVELTQFKPLEIDNDELFT